MSPKIDPMEVFGRDPDNYHDSRADYPREFIEGIIQEIFHDSQLVPVNDPPHIIDMGAGTGKLGDMFLQLGCTTTFIEPNPKLVEFLKDAFGKDSRTKIIQAKADNTGLSDACADIVVMGDSAHWIEPNALSELSRILKPGGQIAAFSRYWAIDSPLTEKLHHLLLEECADYRDSPSQFIRDIRNYKKRHGRHLINEEKAGWKGYSYSQIYSKNELVNYFKGISFTASAIEQDEASFRRNVIEPLWDFAGRNNFLTPEGNLNVPYEINAQYGAPRKRFVAKSEESQKTAIGR